MLPKAMCTPYLNISAYPFVVEQIKIINFTLSTPTYHLSLQSEKRRCLDLIILGLQNVAIIFKVLEKCTKNPIGYSRLALNNHESIIDC